MAALGVVAGAAAAYAGGRFAGVAAAEDYARAVDLRDAPLVAGAAFGARAAVVEALVAGRPERLAPPPTIVAPPRIIVIFDDMGLDPPALDAVMALPGPITLSFLPYADGIRGMAERAKERGDAILLHLPMEPAGAADAGPHSLKTGMSAAELLSALEWNLGRLSGYVGVNNHMGSKFTRDEAAMKTVLAVLAERGLFFVDSLTTGESRATAAGRAVGAKVYARDVFLDPRAGRDTVVRQLDLVERIAIETGFAIAICHPRPDTLAVIGPWLTSAPERGFQLATVEALPELESAWRGTRVAALRN